MEHEHHQWLADVNRLIVEAYERDAEMARQPKNIQRVGHRAESHWEEVLREWLPPQYGTGTRKYILLEKEDGLSVTKETDLVVFHPHYPEKLREKSSVLASGVAAAFSCKRTIDRAAIKEAYEDADTLRRGMTIRDGTPRQHLAPPVFFGLLGGSHGWKNDDPKQKIKAILDEFDNEVESPRLGLDMLCIADLGYWVRSTSIFPEKYVKQQSEQVTEILGTEALVLSAMRHKYDDPQPLAPVTNFIGSLWGKLALNDKSLTPLADGFRITNTYPNSGQLAFKRWKLAELVTPFMVDNVRRGFIPNSDWQYLY
jgi:hypothetical protein